MKTIQNGINSIVSVLLIISIGYFGLVSIQWRPMWMIARSLLLAGLGAPTEGIQVEGEPDKLTCNRETNKCKWE